MSVEPGDVSGCFGPAGGWAALAVESSAGEMIESVLARDWPVACGRVSDARVTACSVTALSQSVIWSRAL